MKLCETESCTGCGACYNVCPKNAIAMQPDSEFGHLRPRINSALCIDCEKCKQYCHIINQVELSAPKSVYAARVKDDEVHIESSSGGIAAALYEHYIGEGYWVAGVAMDGLAAPEYILTRDLQTVKRFKMSKYLQPEMNDIFLQIKEKVQAGDKVLFIGLPCHCAAVKTVFRDCSSVIIVDMVCHGVPATKCMESYICGLQNKTKRTITALAFRSDFGVCLRLYDNEQLFYDRHLNEDPFMQAFISGNLFPESCYQCRYAKPERVGDMTIGDFWGRNKIAGIDKKMGRISVVLLHTEKGMQAFHAISDKLYCEECSVEEAISSNDQLRAPSMKGMYRDHLLQAAKSGQFFECMQELFYKKTKKQYNIRLCMTFIKKAVKKLELRRFR